MESSEEIASKILINVPFIADVYKVVKQAGLNAVKDDRVIDAKNNVCIITPYEPGKNRITDPCKDSRSYSIEYDANDLVVLGGAALNIYDFKLQKLKERRGIEKLEQFVKKKTSDIDIVWWPRWVSTDKQIITSKSTAITTLVQVFIGYLAEGFNLVKDRLSTGIKSQIPGLKNSDMLNISISQKQTFPAGVFNITIQFQIRDISLKMCDIIVHDSGSSQRYDSEGKEITDLRFMTHDPIYCNPKPEQNNSINYLNVNGIDIAVPNIELFVKQQLFAFDNLIRIRQPKSIINYKRVEFIKKILLSFKLNKNNLRNYDELLHVFGSKNTMYPKEIAGMIDGLSYNSINKYHKEIIEVCRTVNKSNDAVVDELCGMAHSVIEGDREIEEELKKYRYGEIKRLSELLDLVFSRIKSAPAQFKPRYDALIRGLGTRKFNLKKMSLNEIQRYKNYYNNAPDESIQQFEALNQEVANWRNVERTRREAVASQIMARDAIARFDQPVPVIQPPYGWAPEHYQHPVYHQDVIYEANTQRAMAFNYHIGRYYYLEPPKLPSYPPYPIYYQQPLRQPQRFKNTRRRK
jgi:hypothetical protein